MHCTICDALLTDFEATRRFKNYREYLDLCNPCFKAVKPTQPVSERKDLAGCRDFDDPLDTEGTDELLYNNYRVLSSIEDIND